MPRNMVAFVPKGRRVPPLDDARSVRPRLGVPAGVRTAMASATDAVPATSNGLVDGAGAGAEAAESTPPQNSDGVAANRLDIAGAAPAPSQNQSRIGDSTALASFPELSQVLETQMQEDVDEKAEEDGIPLTEGYGDGGQSVQDVHLFTDRDVMRRTILRGDAVVLKEHMVDVLKKAKPGEKRRQTIGSRNWEAVMRAGLAKFPVGKLLDAGTSNSRVVFAAPPLHNPLAKVVYHNLLVDLCQVSLRRFTTELTTKQAQTGGRF